MCTVVRRVMFIVWAHFFVNLPPKLLPVREPACCHEVQHRWVRSRGTFMPPPGAVYLGTDGGPFLPPEDADEVLDLAVAPAGSHVLVWISGDLPPVKGQVARTDEAGEAMLVVLEDGAERWVASDDRWALRELQDAPPTLREELHAGPKA